MRCTEETASRPCALGDTAELFGVCLVPYESQLLPGQSPCGNHCRGAACFEATPQPSEGQWSTSHLAASPMTAGIPVPPLSQALRIPEELEEAASNSRFGEPEPGFRESRPVRDGRVAGQEDLGLMRTALGSRGTPACLHAWREFSRVTLIRRVKARICLWSIARGYWDPASLLMYSPQRPRSKEPVDEATGGRG